MTTATTTPSPATAAPVRLPWWTGGDTNAAFGLGFNVMVNVLVLTGLCLGVVHIPAHDVFAVLLPAMGVQLLIGNVYYTYLARRLARRENRTDVTAMPYGPSVPHMFIVTFVIMLPIYLSTKNALDAWAAGLAWCFIIGCIVLIGAFVGPYIRRYTPRAALLGTLAGVSIAFISMRPAAQMWEALWIAMPVLIIILLGFFTGVKLPGNIPVGLAALLVGTAIGWIGGYMHPADVTAAAHDVALSLPTLNFGRLGHGLSEVSPLLATAIPLGIYNFTEGMSNVESAAAAGDSYNLRSVLLADGTGAIVGSALGSPFPPAVYIGHPGWKAAGGRTSYSMASGIVIALLCFLGLFALLGAAAAAAGHRADPALHRPADRRAGVPGRYPSGYAIAVVIAIIPNIASWAQGQMDDVLAAAGTTAAEGRLRQHRGQRGHLQGHGPARRRRGPGRPDARRDHRVPRRPEVPVGRGLLAGRGGAGVHRAHPRHEGGLEHRRPDRARLPVRRGDLRGRLAGDRAESVAPLEDDTSPATA